MTYSDKEHREVFHLLFLERLLRLTDPKLYVLKGGVNLRFFYRSDRYSEDMDIDVLGGGVQTLAKNCYKILKDAAFKRSLQTYGIEELKISDPSKAKQTETTQRFKVRLVNMTGEELPTKVEFSRRTKPPTGSFLNETILPEVVRPYRRLSFRCQHYGPEFAVLQKVQALAGRTEVQARDVFDLYTLYLGGHLSQEFVRSKTNSRERGRASKNLLGLEFSDYLGHVVEYLSPTASEDLKTEDIWQEMCQVVLELLE